LSKRPWKISPGTATSSRSAAAPAASVPSPSCANSKRESKFRDKIAQLEQGLAETEQRLNELQSRKEGASQQFILSPEQQKELENFRKKEAEARKELKLVRRNLRTEIDALETRLKWVNIAAVPAIVAIFGIGLALHRKKRSAAK